MNALQGYGDSDDEEEVGESELRLPTPTKATGRISTDDVLDPTVKPHDWELKEAPKKPPTRKKVSRKEVGVSELRLPTPTKATGRISTDDVLDPTVKPHDWELKEAPKKPPTRKKVIIALPELTNSDSDEEEPIARPKPSGVGATKLLSMLPAPTTSKGLVLPTPLSKNDSKLPDSKEKKPMTTASMVPYALRKKQKQQEPEEEEEDVLPGDFFNMSSKPAPSAMPVEEEEEVDDEYALPAEVEYREEKPNSLVDSVLRTPLEAAVDVHPSQLYNMAPGTSAQAEAYMQQQQAQRGGPGYTEEEAQEIIYKNETEAWGSLRPKGGGTIEIREANVAEALGNVRETILRNMTYRTPTDAAPPSMDALPGKKRKKGEDEPDKTAKRKHQITFLAYQAKQREEALKDQWANNKYSRRQTQQKYGF